MRYLTILLSISLLLVGCSSNEASDEQTNTDDDERLVATTVALVEILDELELDLVGIPTSYKELPERYDDATEVGNAAEPDMEIIKSLKPTDVLSVTTLDAEYDLAPVFENAEIPVTFYDMESVEGMYETIEALGDDYDRQDEAENIIHEFHDKMDEIEAKIEEEDSPSVLILLGVPGSYLVATENSYLGDLVKRAGGENVFPGEDGIEYTAANTEHLQQTDPDIILRAAHGMPDEVVEMFEEEFKENDIWQHFEAVQNDQVYDLEETLFGTTANIRAPEALDTLVDILYPHIN